MSSTTMFTIYRKYKNEKLADDVVANSKQIFLKETQPSGIEFEEQQLTSLYPNILVDDFKKYFEDGIGYNATYFDTVDNCRCSKIINVEFGSGFKELVNHWGMTAGINNSKRSEHRITKAELNQLVMACRYLLNGKYSVEAEDIMSNEFIDVLGSMLPSYEYPLNKDVWYVDKNDDGYILSKGDSVGNKEYYEEEKYGRMILKRLLSIFNVMNISDEEYGYVNNNFDTITELVLIYSAY